MNIIHTAKFIEQLYILGLQLDIGTHRLVKKTDSQALYFNDQSYNWHKQ